MNPKYIIKPGYIMRMVAGAHMVVAIGAAGKDFKGMIRLNESGAWIFEQMKKGITLDKLVSEMVTRYESLDAKTAKQDILDLVEQILFAIEVNE